MGENEMGGKVSIMLVGAGGYGGSYLGCFFKNIDSGVLDFNGIVSSSGARNNRHLESIKSNNIPVFASLEEYCASSRADIAVICSPIHLHASHTCLALEHGMNVLCEKPVSAVIQDNRMMAAARDDAGRFTAIGYDWSFTEPIQNLKKDIMSGVFGRPLRLKTLVFFPRGHKYYSRNRWAGRIKDDEGNWVLDSPVNNATAHYLHNMFYLLGGGTDSSALPVSVEAELYRANDIENYDTAAIRASTGEGVEILFFSTHAVKDGRGTPEFRFEFEEAVVEFKGAEEGIKAAFRNGESRNYGNPRDGVHGMSKVWNCAGAVRGEEEILCGIEAASSHTICVNGMQENMEITPFPDEFVKTGDREGEPITYVEGLEDCFAECYGKSILPGEMKAPWSRGAGKAGLKGYDFFKGA